MFKFVESGYNRLLNKILSKRMNDLEYRMKNRRFEAVENFAEYLVGGQIQGDYMEFGVYKGTTFSYAYKIMSPVFPEMSFFAFDSFEGLPKPIGIDSFNNYTSSFQEGEFNCSEEEFISNLKRNNIDLSRVKTVKGWFNDTLNTNNVEKYKIEKIAAAWIDCDLYESTVPVLEFITPFLSVGTVIIFDDWRCYRNLPDYGEQRACNEWLHKNPQITLRELFSFGFHGVAFTVSSC